MINENDYDEAKEKIQDDLVKKLNADGKSDWVKKPALVDELNAFTALLRNMLTREVRR